MEIIQSIQNRIYTIRGHRVMLDFDLAQLYEVLTKAINQGDQKEHGSFSRRLYVRVTMDVWNLIRSQTTTASLLMPMRSQIVSSSQSKRHTDLTAFAFSEQGAAMLLCAAVFPRHAHEYRYHAGFCGDAQNTNRSI